MRMNQAWRDALANTVNRGRPVAARGQPTQELQCQTVVVDMNYPVLTLRERKLNYKFMLEEAAWILSGSDRVDELPSMPELMRACSDDGVRMAGAYGPRFVGQLDHVVAKLVEDPATRQATLTLWQPNPAPSRDIPCTVAMTFLLRDGELSTHVFMRSSDVWLGLPYDVFSFTMMTCAVLEALNRARPYSSNAPAAFGLGALYLTAASSHLYARDRAAAERVMLAHDGTEESGRTLPPAFYSGHLSGGPLAGLRTAREHLDDLRWWTVA